MSPDSGRVVGKEETENLGRQLQVCLSVKHNHAVLGPSGIKLFGFSAIVLSTIPVAWMYSTCKSLLIGNP